MPESTITLLQQALAMPPAERAYLAEKLISSLGPEDERENHSAWQKEVKRRITE
jgi:hypothetical protein